MGTRTLYRPVGPDELGLIRQSGFRRFPERLAGQPIFYPVLNEEYAREIAERWNMRESGAGYVTRFSVDESFLAKYPVKTVGGRSHQELWVPAGELEEFNSHIIGLIEIIASFSGDESPHVEQSDGSSKGEPR
jgi:hypothetical protein